MALNGVANLNSYSIGLQLTDSANPSLVASGAVTYNHGTVWHGGIVADSVQSTSLAIIANGQSYTGACCTDNSCGLCASDASETSPIDFPQAESYLYELSLYYSEQPTSTGATAVVSYSTLTLTCNNALPYNIFSGVSLTGITSIRVVCGASTSVLVNFNTDVALFQFLGMSLSGGITESKIVYHFPAASLTIAGVGVLGTVFAPFATVDFSGGVVLGNVIAGQYGTADVCNIGQINNYPFDGCLPVHETPLICCTYTNGDFTNGFCSEDNCVDLPGWTVTQAIVESCDDCCVCGESSGDDDDNVHPWSSH